MLRFRRRPGRHQKHPKSQRTVEIHIFAAILRKHCLQNCQPASNSEFRRRSGRHQKHPKSQRTVVIRIFAAILCKH